MKKLFFLLAVTSLGFVACNNDSTVDAEKEAQRVADSTRVADSVKAAEAAAAAAAAQSVDTTKPKDSTVK
jgi:uncharacterized protein YcfL